jgi:hypothetical protein
MHMTHEELWNQLARLDPYETAQRALCNYTSQSQCYTLTLLNCPFIVNMKDKTAYRLEGNTASEPARFLELLCILTYLIHAKKMPLANKLVGPKAFPYGEFFFRGPHQLPNDRMAAIFGQKPEQLCEIAARFNAQRCEFGDASIQLYVLPRLPLTVVIWRQDQEFSARGSILFDQTASDQLPLDALGAAVNLMAEAVIKAHNELSV